MTLRGRNEIHCMYRTCLQARVFGFNGQPLPRVNPLPYIRVRLEEAHRRSKSWVIGPHASTGSPTDRSKTATRHRASTSMYLLTFRVRVTAPPQYERNRTAQAAGASILSPARGVFADMRSVRVRRAVRWAWRITAGLCHAFP